MYPKPEETSNGLFIGKVTFTIRESGEEVTFVSNLPERTHKEVWESAAKRASDYLISRGRVHVAIAIIIVLMNTFMSACN